MDQKGVVTKSISRIVDANMLDEVPKVDKVSMEKGRGLRSQELPQDFCGSDGPVAAFRDAWRDICTCPIRFMRIHIHQRSEERSVGNGLALMCRDRGSPHTT